MTPETSSAIGWGLACFVCGFLAHEAIDQLARVWHATRHKNEPCDVTLTVPTYYGQPYYRQPTHVERVSSMLDKLERRSGNDRRKS